MRDDLQVMRSIDKYDRVGDVGVFELLTDGRMDESGAFTAGVGLPAAQAAFIVGFLNAGKESLIARRFWLIASLENTIIDTSTGKTAFDLLLDQKAPNIAWALDELFDAISSRLAADPRGADGNDRTLQEMAGYFALAETERK